MRITAFVTNTRRGQLADLELRHRRRARAEDRIRAAKDTGLTNLPLHDFAQNEIWCALVALAADLLAWMQTLALTGHDARRWEPKRLRLRLLTIPARHAHTGSGMPFSSPAPICSTPLYHRAPPKPPISWLSLCLSRLRRGWRPIGDSNPCCRRERARSR